MALHAFVEYLKYIWKAKGRHGVHSPFVYDMVEHVLRDKEIIDKTYRVDCPDIPLKYENLVSRIAAYYNYKNVYVLPSEKQTNVPLDMLVLNEVKPAEWGSFLSDNISSLKNDGAVMITGIHKSTQHSDAWKKAHADDRVRVSIDVYGLGLLFFKKEFKEKQHFVLKY